MKIEYDAASIARLHQAALSAGKQRRSRSVEHEVRAKQARACDAEQTGFLTPAYASNYLTTDEQLIVQGRLACSNPSLTASMTAVSSPSMLDSHTSLLYFLYKAVFHGSLPHAIMLLEG